MGWVKGEKAKRGKGEKKSQASLVALLCLAGRRGREEVRVT
jgi:hypothetical protein